MPHESGNPTWQAYPDTSTPITAASLEAIESAVDRSGWGPVCEARLTGDFPSLAIATYFLMRSQMSPTVDTHSMWRQPTAGGPYQVTIPEGWGGRWRAFWQIACDGNGYTPMIPYIVLNAPDSQGNNGSVFDFIAFRNQITSMGQAHGEAVLAAGSKLAFGMYCAATSGTFNLRASLGANSYHRTKLVVAYAGPV